MAENQLKKSDEILEEELLDAIDTITVSTTGNDLYTAITQIYPTQFEFYNGSASLQHSTVIFTDSGDTSGITSLQDVLTSRGDKSTYVT